VGTEHHAIDIARKHTRRVADRLAPPDLHLVRAEYHGIAAELLHPDLERNPGPSRRLLEDHGKHLAGERGRRALAALEGGAELQHAPQLGCIDAVEVEEVPGAAHADRAVQARSTAATAVSTWLRSMIRGGSRRTTLSPAGTVSSPASRQAVTTLPDGITHLRPSSSPTPRTPSITLGKRFGRSASRDLSASPISRTWARKASSSTMSSTALAHAIASGFPPKVLPCVPGMMPDAARSVARQAPTGKPPPRPLAIAITSGTMPAHS